MLADLSTMTNCYILLEDKDACRQNMGRNPLKPVYTDEHILRGSLLVELNGNEALEIQQHFPQFLNYKNHFDPAVKLHCQPEDVRYLTSKQFNLLSGIRSAADRYQLLHTLQWVEELKMGDGVAVAVSTIPTPVEGIIRYIGHLPGENGCYFGVELLVCSKL